MGRCKWSDLCVLKNYKKECDDKDRKNCDMFKHISEKVAELYAKIGEELIKHGSFSYNELWYKTAKDDLIGGGMIINREGFKKIEDKIVEEFLKNKGAQK